MSEINIGPVFQKNFETKKKIVINRGGTRSSKTYSLCQLVAHWLVTGQVRKGAKVDERGVFQIVRKFRSTIEKSVLRDFDEVMTTMGLWGQVKVNKTSLIYEYGDRKVEFLGADDPQKLKGGKRTHLYCNEADELTYEEFQHLLWRLEDGGTCFIDFNPDDEDSWINQELEIKRMPKEGDVDLIVSSYKDNPFLGDGQIQEIERMEESDPLFWQIFGMGEYGKIQGLIYPTFTEVDYPPASAKVIAYGLDFGYTNDPAALVRIFEDPEKKLYFDERLYETGLTNEDLDKRMDELGIHRSDKIWADSAEPKSIEDLRRKGWNIEGAKKGKDSINFGIDVIKSRDICITACSHHLRKELKHYRWMVDKNGKALNKPMPRQQDHLLDALRYAMTSVKGKRKQRKSVFDRMGSFTDNFGSAYR